MLLDVRDIVVRFGGLTAVDGVSFGVAPSTIHGLIGPNGSGKTSTFNVITGFYTVASGSVRFDGRDVTGQPPHAIARAGIVRTFQTAAIQEERTVAENVRLGLYCGRRRLYRALLSRAADAADLARAHELLAVLGLGDLEGEQVKNLSLGLRHKVEIARAMAAAPRLLLLDEPFTGLNTGESGDLVGTIRKIRDGGVTVMLVEHNMKVIMEICDRITVLDAGRRIGEGAPPEVRANPDVVKSYLGTGKSAR
jgi:branched-chain amino acid transport system ATP-binding protein